MADIVPEHAISRDAVNVTDQPQVSKTIVQRVMEMLQRSKKSRERFDKKWHPNYEFVFGGKQWSIDRPSWRFSEVNNFTWATITTEVGLQTDARPKFEFGGKEISDLEFGERLAEVNDDLWEKYQWQQIVQDTVQLVKWVHVAHWEVGWDEELEKGLGDVTFTLLDPFYCYWDSIAKDVNDSRYFIYAAPVPTGVLKEKHPEFADLIKPDVENIGTAFNDITSTTQDRLGTRAMLDRSLRGFERFGGEPQTILIRAWLKDNAMEETQETSVDGTPEYVQKLKYPNGRYIEIANGILLEDGPNGAKIGGQRVAYKDGEFPIVKVVNYSYPLEYAGENEVTHLRGPQRFYNYFKSFMADQMKQGGSPKVLIGSTAGVDPDNISAEPGQKIVANDINQIRFEPGMPLPAGMQFILQDSKDAFDRISGFGSVMQGIVEPAITSGMLFDGYVEAAQVRPRLKNRNLDVSLHKAGRLVASRILQFYTAPRVYRITGKDGYPSEIEFFVTQNDQGQTVADVTSRNMQGQIQGSAQYVVKGLPDVTVMSGSSLPFAKAQKTKNAMELFTAGAIDQVALLEMLDIPNREKIIERMQQAAAQAPQGVQA